MPLRKNDVILFDTYGDKKLLAFQMISSYHDDLPPIIKFKEGIKYGIVTKIERGIDLFEKEVTLTITDPVYFEKNNFVWVDKNNELFITVGEKVRDIDLITGKKEIMKGIKNVGINKKNTIEISRKSKIIPYYLLERHVESLKSYLKE